MAFARARAFRAFQSSLRHSGRRAAAPARTQLVQRRYASGGGHGAESSSDLPWAIGAVVVTIPSAWYLWPEESHAEHGAHGGEHAEHAEESEGGKEEEAPQGEEESKEESSEGGEEKSEGDGGDEKEQQDSQDTTPTKSSGNTDKALPPGGDDSQTKSGGGKKDEGKSESDGEEKESSDDSESKNEGGEDGGEEEGKDEGESKAKPKKYAPDTPKRPRGQPGTMEEKQFGFSNTDTRHPLKDAPDKSRKADGGIETAKQQGTVDPSRPLK